MKPLRIIPHIHRATHQIGLYIAALQNATITQAEAHVLDHLAVGGECTVGELHRAFAHRRSTLTSVLDRLVKKNLVLRQASAKDRRTFVIGLTEKGKTVAGLLHKELQQVEERTIGSVAARDVNGLQNVLNGLEAALTEFRRQHTLRATKQSRKVRSSGARWGRPSRDV